MFSEDFFIKAFKILDCVVKGPPFLRVHIYYFYKIPYVARRWGTKFYDSTHLILARYDIFLKYQFQLQHKTELFPQNLLMCLTPLLKEFAGKISSRNLQTKYLQGICRQNIFKEFAGKIFSRNLQAKYFQGICRQNIFKEFAGKISSRNLQAKYHQGICRQNIFQEFADKISEKSQTIV